LKSAKKGSSIAKFIPEDILQQIIIRFVTSLNRLAIEEGAPVIEVTFNAW
jgi:hypothetical protein